MTTTDWIDEELKNISAGSPEIERLPTLKFEDGKVVEILVDASKPFQKWTGTAKGSTKDVTKAIIPCTVKGVKMNFWVNIKNPIYGKIMLKIKEGTFSFNIIQTGTQAETRYTIMKD